MIGEWNVEKGNPCDKLWCWRNDFVAKTHVYSGFTGSTLHSQTWYKIAKTQAYSGFSWLILHSQI